MIFDDIYRIFTSDPNKLGRDAKVYLKTDRVTQGADNVISSVYPSGAMDLKKRIFR